MSKGAGTEDSEVMEFVLLALAGGGVLVWLGLRLRERRARDGDQAEVHAQVRKLCDEDIAILGEELRRLEIQTAPHPHDACSQSFSNSWKFARIDYYQDALDAHGSAQRVVGRTMDADEIRKVTKTLASGRYALACAQARVEGRPVPELRVPCFFNPQHGPSVFDVAFTPRGHGTHKVPACAVDVAAHRANEKPDIRQVEVGGRRVPYYEAGDAFAPYGEGYFTGDAAIQRLFVTSTSWPDAGLAHRRYGDGFDTQGNRSDGMFN